MNNALLSYGDAVLYRSGEPYRILAGAIHYFRVHPELWQDRLRRLKAMGAHTVDTYRGSGTPLTSGRPKRTPKLAS
ncbi:beta-galactosidase [Arthrobacter sp. efr-133-TYG-104]|uniref:beta-galactosidase n=1 Tax=Arthrobacter sp. efr-133-TYG-104 TaxID=3040324 RepID=UPI00254D688B|nr:beta-galactosidase [Arthrobacter sp. efr-133-TYG-104]